MTLDEDTARRFAEGGYESQDLTPSQRADLAQHAMSALRLTLGVKGWAQTRQDRWEESPTGPGRVVEINYVYGETRARLWPDRSTVVPTDVFSFFGQAQDSDEMNRFNRSI